jgi:PAS domain S-box-containing protein
MPVTDLIAHLFAMGFYGEGESDQLVAQRRRQLVEGDLTRESRLNDGRILELKGFHAPEGGYVYISQDVTAQRRAESATKELAAIVASSDSSILSLSTDGIIASWNPGAEKLYGYTAEEAVGQPFQLLTGDSVQSENQESILRRALRGEQPQQTIGQRTHKDGHTFSISLRMSPILGDDGSVVGVSGVAYDVTEQLRTERALAEQRDQLQLLNGQKNRLFSIIAHDLRTPFNSLLGFSEILSQNVETLSPAEISEYAAMMHDSALQANSLLEALLEWSRLQMGGLKNEPRPFDIIVAIKTALAFNGASATNKNITVECADRALLSVLADPQMVDTVLRNLIANAIKFTDMGGAISVHAVRDGGDISISIRDNGIGIAPDRLARLFQFETNLSTAGTEGEKGTGLGLQLCKELVELQGGAMSVESALGQGSTFSFTLPSAI